MVFVFPNRQLCDEILGPMNFDAVQDRSLEMGGAATMLTEFGLCYPDVNNPISSNTGECEFILSEMERRWEYVINNHKLQ